jgi:hypothetical protein
MVPQRLLAVANQNDAEWFLKSGVGRFENLSCFPDGFADQACAHLSIATLFPRACKKLPNKLAAWQPSTGEWPMRRKVT